jgi:predicted nucleic acid-binding protein
MNLVIDANILLAALINPCGTTHKIIFDDSISLFAPEFLFEEFLTYKELIVKKSGLKPQEIEQAARILKSRINIVPQKHFEKERDKAKLFTPDQDDVEYLGLALFLLCPLWSNNKALKKQTFVKIISTREVIQKRVFNKQQR